MIKAGFVRILAQGIPVFITGTRFAVYPTFLYLMSSSSHTRSVVIGIEYQNCCRTLDVYLLFAIWMGQIQSKLIYIFVTYELASL